MQESCTPTQRSVVDKEEYSEGKERNSNNHLAYAYEHLEAHAPWEWSLTMGGACPSSNELQPREQKAQ